MLGGGANDPTILILGLLSIPLLFKTQVKRFPSRTSGHLQNISLVDDKHIVVSLIQYYKVINVAK